MPENPNWTRSLRASATITLAIGLIFVAVGAESLAVYDACVAYPACLPDASGFNAIAFFAILAVGIALSVAGAWIAFAGMRSSDASVS